MSVDRDLSLFLLVIGLVKYTSSNTNDKKKHNKTFFTVCSPANFARIFDNIFVIKLKDFILSIGIYLF
jgi:hypothetical protein